MPIALLGAVFAIVAAIYACIGFGGGSSYIALLLLWGVAATVVPFVSLACNIIVVASGSARYAHAQITPWAKALPLVICAAPIAYLGGLTPIKSGALVMIMGVSLLLSALALMLQPRSTRPVHMPPYIVIMMAMMLGYLAGITGIGGGIFLAPILHLIRWDAEKRVAATASLFILVNSVFGMAGQIQKFGLDSAMAAISGYWPLCIAVLLGGAMGSHLGLAGGNAVFIRRITAILVSVAGLRILLS